MLKVEVQLDEVFPMQSHVGWYEVHGAVETEAVCRVIADEDAVATRGMARWLNSARLHVDEDTDEVTCVVSVGDPRGGFAFKVRRTPDGRILLHTPHPGEGAPHLQLAQLHPGTYQVVGQSGAALRFEDEDEDE